MDPGGGYSEYTWEDGHVTEVWTFTDYEEAVRAAKKFEGAGDTITVWDITESGAAKDMHF